RAREHIAGSGGGERGISKWQHRRSSARGGHDRIGPLRDENYAPRPGGAHRPLNAIADTRRSREERHFTRMGSQNRPGGQRIPPALASTEQRQSVGVEHHWNG